MASAVSKADVTGSTLIVDPLADAEGVASVGLLSRLLIDGAGSGKAVTGREPEGLTRLVALLSPSRQPSPQVPPVQTVALSETTSLLSKATVAALTTSEFDTAIRSIGVANGAAVAISAGLRPAAIPRLIEVNPNLAVELVACLLKRPDACTAHGGLESFLTMLLPVDPSQPVRGPANNVASSRVGAADGGQGEGRTDAGPPLSLQLLEVVSRLVLPDSTASEPPGLSATTAAPAAQANVRGGRKGTGPGTQAGPAAAAATSATLGSAASQADATPTALVPRPEVPPEWLRLFVSRCLHAVAGQPDKGLQTRQVRLVCVFLTSLLRSGVVQSRSQLSAASALCGGPPPDSWEDEADVEDGAHGALLSEIQAFAVEFSRVKEAAGLYRMLVNDR